ncbi:MAG: thermonuclease family protein [Mesorhizobium sp.]
MVLLAVLIALAARLDRKEPVEPQGRPTVNDGDSLAFGSLRVRLVGIDAPEYGQTCVLDGADYACGKRSREALGKAIGGQVVSCSGSDHDRYGRLLAVCSAGGLDLNRAQVEAGWAVSYGGYRAEEAKARAVGAGIWAGSFERPQDWRRDHGATTEAGEGNLLAQGGDWLRQTLRFWAQATYSLLMDLGGNDK